MLRPSASLEGNAETEQGIWINARRLIAAEHGSVDSDHVVWCNSCGQVTIGPDWQKHDKTTVLLVMREFDLQEDKKILLIALAYLTVNLTTVTREVGVCDILDLPSKL